MSLNSKLNQEVFWHELYHEVLSKCKVDRQNLVAKNELLDINKHKVKLSNSATESQLINNNEQQTDRLNLAREVKPIDLTKCDSEFIQKEPRFSSEHKARTSLTKEFQELEFTQLNSLIKDEGYLKLKQVIDFDFNFWQEMSLKLRSLNLPTVFSFIYKDLWCLPQTIAPLVENILGRNFQALQAFWLWRIEGTAGSAQDQQGWQPHRDRDYTSLRADGSPKYLTVWLPISAATPENSCIYVVPAKYDRSYGSARDMSWEFNFQDVRALPAKPGDLLCWNHALLHWGSRAAAHSTSARVSLAFEFAGADARAPENLILKPEHHASFNSRAQLIAGQLKNYLHMYTYPDEVIEFVKSNLK
jgi:hypothetical protein